MAEQVVTLNPGESKVVSFTATPSVAKTYQVAVDGLTGSFVASEIPVKAARLYGYITDNETGEPVFGADITVYQDYDTKTADYHVYTDEKGYYEITGMIPEISGKMVIYAGGYKDYTKTGIPIHEGDNERNIVLTWAGGSRFVPEFVSYSLPSQVMAGEEFPVSMTIWLPYPTKAMRVVASLVINTSGGAYTASGYCGDTTIEWKLLPDFIYDQCDQGWLAQEGYIRFDHEGQYLLRGIGKATHECQLTSHWEESVPPGIYDVEVQVEKNYTSVSAIGRLTYYSSEHPDYYSWKAKVGTVEVLHTPSLASLTGVITHVDTGERLDNVKVTISGPVSASVTTSSEGEYEFLNLPVGDFTITLRDSRWYLTPGGWWDWGYVYATYNVSLKQGWNTKDMIV